MERHDTHALSYSSSEEHSYYYFDNNKNLSTKNISSENHFYEKEEEKNEWSKILISNFKEIKNIMGIQDELFNLNEKSYNKSKNEVNNSDGGVEKNIDKNNEKKIKENNKDNSKENDEKNKKYDKNDILNINNEENKEKKEVNETKNEENLKSDEKEEKKKKGEKMKILNNGIIVKKINKTIEDNKSNFLDNKIMKDYFSHYNKIEEIKKPKIINKPNYCFITKYTYNSKLKGRYIKKSFIKKKNTISSLGSHHKLNQKNKQIFPSTDNSKLKRQKEKSKTILVNRNNNNLDNKFSSLSTITSKKLTICDNSSLFINRSKNKNKNNIDKKRPLSSYNVIKKEIDLNLRCSKLDSSFYNKSFTVQKTCQISSIISMNNNNANIFSKKRKNNNKLIYENKNFSNDLKELKNAFEISESNINNNINSNKNNVSVKTNKNKVFESTYENNINNNNLLKRKLNSAKVRVKSYNYFYPKELTPLFYEYTNKKNNINKNKSDKNKICKKCGYKRHFGCEKNCPICIDIKEKNKLNEKKLNNLIYYFPFKNKNETNNSIQNSFRSNYNNSINKNKIRQISNHDNFIYFTNLKMENLVPMDCYYNPIYLNNINITLSKGRKLKLNSIKKIGNEKRKIEHKYNELQKYFD